MIRRFSYVLLFAALAGAAVSAAPGPRVLAGVMPGVWEVSERADGHGAQRVCLDNTRVLLQWEHKSQNCGYRLLSTDATTMVVDYNCGAPGFGHSRLTKVTPRTLKVETQGISGGFPFKTTIHARRVGNCAPR